MKDKKIRLTEKDLHIIDVYSKKNLSDTMPQFGNQGEVRMTMQGTGSMKNDNKTDIYG